jgi:hypothetical protein
MVRSPPSFGWSTFDPGRWSSARAAAPLEHVLPAADADGLGVQIVEVMARLGCRLLETAGALSEAPPAEDSVVSRV